MSDEPIFLGWLSLDPAVAETDQEKSSVYGRGRVPCGCPMHPEEIGIVSVPGHLFKLDTSVADHKWRWLCSCGGRGRWTWQADSAAYHSWLRHVRELY